MASPAPSLLYRALAGLAAGALPAVAPLAGDKVARSVRARRGVLARLEAWGRLHRDPARPLVWVHAPSVGEGLQAQAVLREVRRRHPGWQVAWTHFSPSAAALAARQQADIAESLPWDTPGNARRALAALRPSVLAFAKLDLWPELACAAAARGVPVAVIAATVSPVSSRLRWPARTLLRPGYRSVAAAGAVSAGDARRLALLGTPPERIEVLGDPRFDSVLDVIASVDPNDPLLRLRPGAPALVAGSTWPADEAVVLPALAEVRRVHPESRLVLAPHEPTPRHLTGIRAEARRLGLPDPVRLDEATPDTPLVLVDRVGLLARLYGVGALALVGGGFGRAGLHSVLEPAGWGLPVVFGPRWQASREAGMLIEQGGGTALDQPAPARQLAAWWSRMIADRGERERAGRAAAAVIDAGRGAAVRQAELLEGLVRTGG